MSIEKSFAYSVLGPIFLQFVASLARLVNEYNSGSTSFLFVSRAGLRIRYLLNSFLEARQEKMLQACSDFMISRISVAKACFFKAPMLVASYFADELRGLDVASALSIICKRNFNLPSRYQNKKTDSSFFLELLDRDNVDLMVVSEYFRAQEYNFDLYLKKLTSDKNFIVLIDSGWIGSTQKMLMTAYPQFQWAGAYFGKWDYRGEKPKHLSSIKAISVDSDKSPMYKKIIFFHHHIVESILEPRIKSVEEYLLDATGEAVSDVSIHDDGLKPGENDVYFAEVVRYVVEYAKLPNRLVETCANEAFRKLAKKILFPSCKDVALLSLGDRSADFGRDNFVPIVYFPRSQRMVDRINSIRKSLWKQGQIKIEFGSLSHGFNLLYFSGVLIHDYLKYGKLLRTLPR